jgi:hypothetical protein
LYRTPDQLEDYRQNASAGDSVTRLPGPQSHRREKVNSDRVGGANARASAQREGCSVLAVLSAIQNYTRMHAVKPDVRKYCADSVNGLLCKMKDERRPGDKNDAEFELRICSPILFEVKAIIDGSK